MSNSSSGEPARWVCLPLTAAQQVQGSPRKQAETLEPPWSGKVLVLGMLEVEKWDGDSWGPASSSVEPAGRVMSHGGFSSP